MRIAKYSAFLLFFASALPAQSNTSLPAPTTQSSLSTVGGSGDASDSASLPIVIMRYNDLGISAGTPIEVHLDQAVDSAHAVNGQTLHGKLVKAVGNAPAGSPVDLTVVTVAAAGQMSSAGELSLQIVRIRGQDALSQVITEQGQKGPRLAADAAPARGTEASISTNQTLIFPAS